MFFTYAYISDYHIQFSALFSTSGITKTISVGKRLNNLEMKVNKDNCEAMS